MDVSDREEKTVLTAEKTEDSETGKMLDEKIASERVVKISLDYMEAGEESGNEFGRYERYSKTLPEGITSKMLYRDVFRIGWPALLELLLTQLTGMFDLMQVGSLGTYAIAGVGVANQIKFLFMTVFLALNVGLTAMIARARGAKDMQLARLTLRQGAMLNLISSTLVSVIGYILSPALIRFVGPSDSAATITAGIEYLRINLIGFVFLALTSTATAALRGVGNSRYSLVYNTVANVVNVFLNWVLINGMLGFPRLEVRGAAIATVMGQNVAFVIALFSIFNKKNYLYIDLKLGFKPDREVISGITRIGIPSAIEQLIMRAGIMIYTLMITSLGTVAYGIHQICMNLQAMSFMNGQAFGIAATSLVGQSLGKHRPDMAQAYSKRCQNLGAIVAAGIGLTFVLFGKTLAGLYDKDTYVIEVAAKILIMIALTQPLMSSQLVLSGTMRGAGDTKVIAMITFATVLVFRPAMAALFIYVFDTGIYGAWYAMTIDQVIRTVLVVLRYRSGKWKTAISR
ncbi:MAG: MATE family efflux transporter [Ruminococcaceae bacterium]|nr:MATE family efflux transporter [Oscillospiraceae bacterium]